MYKLQCSIVYTKYFEIQTQSWRKDGTSGRKEIILKMWVQTPESSQMQCATLESLDV